MYRVAILLISLCLTLVVTNAIRGQTDDVAGSGANGQTRSEAGFVTLAPLRQDDNVRADDGISEAVVQSGSDQDSLPDIDEINPTNGGGGFSRAQGFGVSNPGAGIGSDFFGLDDNFDDGLLIRSGNVAMKIGGFLKVDLIQDFNPIGSTDSFNVATIEVGVPPRQNTRFHARQTRLNTDIRWNSDRGPIRVFIEGDFFFNQRESAELGENRFRLRHAYAQHGKWIAGQTWTTLSDVAASPATLDFEGQVASVTTRRTQIRWTQDIADSDWTIALALEDPFTIIDVPPEVTGEARTQTPDAVGRLRWSRPLIQAQVAGVVRQLGFQPTGLAVRELSSWGLNFTQVTKLTRRTKFYSEILWGSGIGSFKGIPDVAQTVSQGVEVVGSLGWMVGATHEWTGRLSSNITFAENRSINIDGLLPDALDNVTYMACNLIYAGTERSNVGIEYLYGLRENFDGQSAVANRIQIAFTYYLP